MATLNTLLQKIRSFRLGSITFPLFLLALCLLAYGPFLNRLGFYWDDFPINWIASTMGPTGLARYFSGNRPVWGLIYQFTTSIFGSQPLTWQIFALLMRWITGLAFWQLLRLVWPSRVSSEVDAPVGRYNTSDRETFAAWAAALFVIYPGFSQQYISFVYSHFFIVLTFLLLSLCLMVMALRTPRRFRLLTAASLLLSPLNLLTMEYFFLLDLLRPLLIWSVLSDPTNALYRPDPRVRIKQTLVHWLPYLAVFIAAMFWRSVLFGFRTYQPMLVSRIKTEPLLAITGLVETILGDVWKVSAGAWAHAFTIPTVLEVGARNLQRYWILVAAGTLAAALYLWFYRARETAPGESGVSTVRSWWSKRKWTLQPLGIGILALLIAGGPFWLTDLPIVLTFSNDRFTLPFMFGASMVIAGLLVLLPLPRAVRVAMISIGLGFAIGLQLSNAISYTIDWSVQRQMFWEMTWRMPSLKPGTALLINELPVTHYTDNSLTAPLNWTFDPNNDPQVMKYALLYPTLRKDEYLNEFQKDQPVEWDYLATTFHGSTSQMVALYFKPPGCVRVLDPQIDIYNWTIPLYLKESLSISTTAPILPAPPAGESEARPPAHIYGAEIAHGWCYYFEKADLARQSGDWETIVSLDEQAAAINDYPNDPLERFPFIEGYAQTGNWDRAIELSRNSYAVSPEIMRPMLCKLWDRIESSTSSSPDQLAALETVHSEFQCSQATK